MIDYYSKDKRNDLSKERLRRAEEQYQTRMRESLLLLAAVVLIVLEIIVVLF